MFTIQYEAIDGSHKLQEFNSNSRARLVKHLVSFQRPIVAVYEQATVITKTIQRDLANFPGYKTQHARDFSRPMTPA